ncbi:hypothetical protein [Klebsiella sp. BIGb0407]|uniref:hypothetical protein n=1 Tax=Klebsiella sp. BIGb0407 TaxID=2940603 RepID=UPI0021684EE9|nr:hypothetical protein [Klebsiella sp. BIGb0407]MCS3430342.1 hypothetical protein [Klebsiella sp. BIGb0407]
MPVSSIQHRASSGVYQNKQHDNINNNTNPVHKLISNHSALPDEIIHFGKNICRIINSSEKQPALSSLHRTQSPSVIVPALLLLSQIRLTGGPSDRPSFISDRDNSLLSSENRIYSDNRDNGFNALLNPVVNALYKTGEMISRYDPLKFPCADATSLSAKTTGSETTPDRHFLSEHLTKKINELMSTISDGKQTEVIKKMIDELNNITIEAEKEFPSSRSGHKSIENLIYLIDKSKHTIDSFEIKHSQDTLCDTLRLQIKDYVKIASNMCGEISKFKWRNYLEAQLPLTFTPDARGDSFPSVESQIAGNLVKNVFGFNDEQGNTSVYGSRYDAYSSLLTILLAEKKINSINFLPDGGDQDAENIRLVNLLLRDLEININNKGSNYLLKAAKIFFDSYHKALRRDHKLSAEEVEDKIILSDSDKEQLHILRHTLRQPIEINYNQYPDSPRFVKLLELFVTIQCITEAMHRNHLPEGRRDGSDHHYNPRIDTHNIRSYLQCKSVANLELIYNESNHELQIVPTSGRSHHVINNNVMMGNILKENKKIDKIKFKPITSLRHVKNHSSLSTEFEELITPKMYLDNKEQYAFSIPNALGLITDGNSFDIHEYVEFNHEFIKIKHIPYPPFVNNRYVIEGDNNLYLRYRKDEKLHPETHNERLNVDKIVDFIEIKSNVEPLTLDERYALRTYNRTTYNNIHNIMPRDKDELIISDIDEFIIKGMPENYSPPELRKSMAKIIDNIEHALPRTKPYNGTVYKHTIISKEKFNSLKKDQLLTSKTFLSFTKDNTIPIYLLKKHIASHNLTDTHTPIQYTFNIKKSGHSLEWYTEKFYDGDVFIESNKIFRIKNIDSLEVTADEINSSILSDEEKSLAKNIDYEL